MKTVAVIGALDTKGPENQYLVEQLRILGVNSLVVNTGILGDPQFEPAVSAVEVAQAAGEDLMLLRKKKDRPYSLDVMGRGAGILVRRLYDEGKIQGAIAIGGSQGTYMGTCVMQALPVDVPKVLLSTIVFQGLPDGVDHINDTYVSNSLVDIGGLNSILRRQIRKSAAVLSALLNVREESRPEVKGTIALTMWGIVTACVDRVQQILRERGYEVVIFHATGIGGSLMERYIHDGAIDAVADITTVEVMHEVVDSPMGYSGHTRLTAAAACGIPQVIVPGGMDAVNIGSKEMIPERWQNRRLHRHTPWLWVMRTTAQDMFDCGKVMAERLNKSTAPVIVALPLKGLSFNDCEGGDFYDPEADKVLFETLKQYLRSDIPVREFDLHINDPAFAQEVAQLTIDAIELNNKGR